MHAGITQFGQIYSYKEKSYLVYTKQMNPSYC